MRTARLFLARKVWSVVATVIDENVLAALDFEMRYRCANARHTVRRHAPSVNMWRDIFPAGLDGDLAGKRAGERVSRSFSAAQLAGPRQSSLVRTIDRRLFSGELANGVVCHADSGRFLPSGTLYRAGIGGIYRDSLQPFRVVDATPDAIVADLNPPFAGFDASVSVTVRDIKDKLSDVGGRCQDWGETLISGAGIGVRAGDRPTQFFVRNWNERVADSDDRDFYANARMVTHLDRTAIAVVTELYADLIKPGDCVLDLMSSVASHLPQGLSLQRVAGLGMNAEELAANPALNESVVHDLNVQPVLPFETGSFDAVICTVSVEYLVEPLAVFAEVARVLKPGGVLAVTFSNRWFPPKVIKVWRDAHPNERLGLVLEYFLLTGRFEDLHSLSVEGLPRPEDDRHIAESGVSDPVFAVWGRRARDV